MGEPDGSNPARALIERADIVAAARYRLRGWAVDQIEAGVRAAEAGIAGQAGLQAAGEAWVKVKDRRDPWTAFCALLCLLAAERGDDVLLFRVGYEVIEGYRQSQRATGRQAADALNDLLRDRLDARPGLTPKELWEEMTRIARDDFHDVLIEFDTDTGVLGYEPRPGAEMVDIDFTAFRRRVQRISRGQVRQLPATVAPLGAGCLP